MKYWKFRLCLLLAALELPLSLAGCTMRDGMQWEQLDLQLYGALVHADGKVDGKIPVSFSGEIPVEGCSEHKVHTTQIKITLPEDFLIPETSSKEASVMCHPADDLFTEYYLCLNYSYTSDIGMTPKYSFVFPGEGLLILHWPEYDENLCFVASQDPDADLALLLEQYRRCLGDSD